MPLSKSSKCRRAAQGDSSECAYGYAIPFYFYDEFMKFNGLYDQVANDGAAPFPNSPLFRDALLRRFRTRLRTLRPAWMTEA